MKKGVSLIILVVTIVLLGILAGVAIMNANYMIADTNITKLKTDISQIESLMKTYKVRKNGIINFDSIEFDLSTLSNTELKQFEDESILDNKVTLYVIDLYEIDAEATNYGNLKQGVSDRYLYSDVTGKVYYELGVKVDDITYHYVMDGE